MLVECKSVLKGGTKSDKPFWLPSLVALATGRDAKLWRASPVPYRTFPETPVLPKNGNVDDALRRKNTRFFAANISTEGKLVEMSAKSLPGLDFGAENG